MYIYPYQPLRPLFSPSRSRQRAVQAQRSPLSALLRWASRDARSARAAARRGSCCPRRGPPRRGNPRRGNPRRGNPRRGNPRRGNPRRGDSAGWGGGVARPRTAGRAGTPGAEGAGAPEAEGGGWLGGETGRRTLRRRRRAGCVCWGCPTGEPERGRLRWRWRRWVVCVCWRRQTLGGQGGSRAVAWAAPRPPWPRRCVRVPEQSKQTIESVRFKIDTIAAIYTHHTYICTYVQYIPTIRAYKQYMRKE